MLNTKLLDLLRGISEKEIQLFEQYIHSSLFNTHQKLKDLYAILAPFAPTFDDRSLDKQIVYKKLYKTDRFNSKQFNHLTSNLLKLLYDYLAFSEFQKDTSYQKLSLMTTLLNRKKNYHFEKQSKKFEQSRNNSTIWNNNFLMGEIKYQELQNEYHISKGIRNYDAAIQAINDNLNKYYLGYKLKLACELYSRSQLLKEKYNWDHLEEIIKIVNTSPTYLREPQIAIYFKIFQFLEGQRHEENYNQLKKLMKAYYIHFSKSEQMYIYRYMINYCIKKANYGEGNFHKELLGIYKFMLEKSILLINDKLEQWTFKNIVTVGTKLREFVWVEQFIHDYQYYLPKDERASAVTFNLASLYYAQKSYHKALQQLSIFTDFLNPSYHIGAKTIQLKSYYKLRETEAFLALIDAFKNYLRRNKKLAKSHINSTLNFIRLAKRIYILNIARNTISTAEFNRRYKTLRLLVETTTPLSSREWLLEVLEEI